MTYSIGAFKAQHFAMVSNADDIQGGAEMPDPYTLSLMEQSSNVVTVFHDGFPIAVGGTLQLWPGRHMAFCAIPQYAGRHMTAITRIARALMAAAPGRIEASVLVDFAAGHRWMKLLGFKVETPRMELYDPNGRDHTGYVRINR